MNTQRVLLTSDENELYHEFWNPISKIWKTKFGIDPTLIWFGEKDDILKLNLSEQYGNIIISEAKSLKENFAEDITWYIPYALFYYTKFYPNETCLTIGIDQVPLSQMFIKNKIENYDNDKYLILTDDHYLESGTPYWTEPFGRSPSSYHIAKGKVFDEMFKFEKTFEKEVEKIYYFYLINKNKIPTSQFNHQNLWGLDEMYISEVNRNSLDKIVCLSLSKFLVSRRIECNRNLEPNYDLQLLKSGFFVEGHLCRPYHNHKQYLDTLFENIPHYV